MIEQFKAVREGLGAEFDRDGETLHDEEASLRQFVYEAVCAYVESHFLPLAAWVTDEEGDPEPPGVNEWVDAYAAGDPSAEGYQVAEPSAVRSAVSGENAPWYPPDASMD